MLCLHGDMNKVAKETTVWYSPQTSHNVVDCWGIKWRKQLFIQKYQCPINDISIKWPTHWFTLIIRNQGILEQGITRYINIFKSSQHIPGIIHKLWWASCDDWYIIAFCYWYQNTENYSIQFCMNIGEEGWHGPTPLINKWY